MTAPLVIRTAALDRLYVAHLFPTGPEGNSQREYWLCDVTERVSQR